MGDNTNYTSDFPGTSRAAARDLSQDPYQAPDRDYSLNGILSSAKRGVSTEAGLRRAAQMKREAEDEAARLRARQALRAEAASAVRVLVRQATTVCSANGINAPKDALKLTQAACNAANAYAILEAMHRGD